MPTLLPACLLGGASSATVRRSGSPTPVAACVPGFGPTLMQHAPARAPHHNPDSPQTSDSSAARPAAGSAAASAAGGSPRAAWSIASSAAARTPQGPAAWSRGFGQSLSASDSSHMLPPEPAAPYSFPLIHAASMPAGLGLFSSAALGTPAPAAGSQASPSLLGYPPLLGTENPLDDSMGHEGTGDCFPGAAPPSSYTWSADSLFVAPGIGYLPGTTALVPCPAHDSSPVDCATFH